MDIKVVSEKNNPLLGRKEVKFALKYEGATPAVKDVKMKLVAILNANKELLVIDELAQEFGKMEANGYAKIYESEEAMNSIEKKSIIEKNKIVEEAEEAQE
ncbi:30S ribosomal protein S24e [Methanococcus voltae]|uniref:Small ribosomal subunit protein eS24 n=1 Tax=Methanococcus voltae (strain ATCC BAA-1334 / A3) TaxID=456320 RepID=D7DRA4_METV3|nr:30S ribosomal protein S24e [Methanococcus voltae]MCS3901041.1 small subunit ribosomal protein S24e [Methanococcus voltae]